MHFWLTVALLFVAGLHVLLQPPLNLAAGSGVLASCPTRFADWSGEELSFDDAVVEELAADDLLIRRYQRGDQTVWLCMVYHQNRRYGAHDPKLCYESQGYSIMREARRRLKAAGERSALDVNFFVADRSRDRRVVYYWWTTRGLATPDANNFRRRMALDGILENRSWGAFVRVEALVRDGDEARAERAAAEFAGLVAGSLPSMFAVAETGSAARR